MKNLGVALSFRIKTCVAYIIFISTTSALASQGFDHCFKSLSQLGNTSYQNAIGLIAQHKWQELKDSIKPDEISEDGRVTLALLTLRNKKAFAEILPLLRLSEAARVILAMQLAIANPSLVHEHISLFDLPQEIRFEIAMAIITEIEISKYTLEFNLSESQWAEVIKKRITLAPGETFDLIRDLRITDSELLAEIYVFLSGYSTELLTDNNKYLEPLSTAQRYRVLLALSETRPDGSMRVGNLSRLIGLEGDSFTVEQKESLASRMLVRQYNSQNELCPNSVEAWYSITVNNGLKLPQTSRASILLYILRNVNQTAFSNKNHRDQFILRWFNNDVVSVLRIGPSILKVYFERDPLDAISAMIGENVDNIPLIDEGEGQSLQVFLTKISEETPELITTQMLKLLWDRFENKNVALRLLKLQFQLKDKVNLSNIEDSLQLLSLGTGLEYQQLKESAFVRSPVLLYELLLELQDYKSGPVFERVKFSDDCFKDKKLLTLFLEYAADSVRLSEDKEKAVDEVLSTLKDYSNDTVNKEALVKTTNSLKVSLVEKIASRFKGSSLEFNYEDFKNLESKWGDLEPIWTLLSRYVGKEAWNKEINIMGKIFSSVLTGQFEQYKFYGLPQFSQSQAQAEEQLAFLNADQKEIWTKNRTQVQVLGNSTFDVEEAARFEEERKKDAKKAALALVNIFNQNIDDSPKARNHPDKTGKFLAAFGPEFLESTIHKRDPLQLLSEVIEELSDCFDNVNELGKWLFINTLRELSTNEVSIDRVLGSTRFLRSIFKHFPSLISEEQNKAFTEESIRLKKLADSSTRDQNSAIVFSVLSHDPKLLLMTGTLTNKDTCLSYRTGSNAHTLPGYVLDANTRILTGWIIKQSHFEKAIDYTRVYRRLTRNEPVDMKWDGNRRQVKFRFNEEGHNVEVLTLPLEHAYYRRLIKIGKGHETLFGALRVERAYMQDHQGVDQIKKQVRIIFKELEREMKLAGPFSESYSEFVSFIKSRNPLGAYSDNGGGANANNYVIGAIDSYLR